MSIGSSNTKIVLALLGIAAVLGAGGYGVVKFLEHEEKKSAHSQVKKDVEYKGRNIAEIVKVLKNTAENYVANSARDGLPLPPGHIVTLEELRERRALDGGQESVYSKVVRFSYVVLDDKAPDNAILLELVTVDSRAIMDKAGRGSLYRP